MVNEYIKTTLLKNRNKMFRMAQLLLGNKEEAEDVIQDVYLKIWSRPSLLANTENPGAYAMRMIRNLSLDRLKVRKSRAFTEVSESTKSSQEIDSPFALVSFNNLKELMLQLFNTLPPQQREIIYLRDIEHYTYEEIEEITGMSINTIRVNLSRARKNVRMGYSKIKNYETK